jgi:hypothetical protein
MGSKPVEYRVAYRLLEQKPCPCVLRNRRSDKHHFHHRRPSQNIPAFGLGPYRPRSRNELQHLYSRGELEVSSDGTYDREQARISVRRAVRL